VNAVKSLQWKDNVGKVYTTDDIVSMISPDRDVYVGSDSHRGKKGSNVVFATAICLWSEDVKNGGWYCFRRSFLHKKKFKDLFGRLQHEVQCSLDVACELRDEFNVNVREIHVNVNPDENEESGKYAKQFKGMVEAYGFTCILKPDDWAAGGVADKHAR
jgi:predicted RNase H-related nuclease YkuK (DUF458 family)